MTTDDFTDAARAEAERRWPRVARRNKTAEEWLDEGMASGFVLGAQWSAAQEPTDEMVDRAHRSLISHHGYGRILRSQVCEALTAALTEPPARPEGAEDIEAWLDGMPESIRLGDEHQRLFANHLAHMGFRVPVALAEASLTEKKENAS